MDGRWVVRGGASGRRRTWVVGGSGREWGPCRFWSAPSNQPFGLIRRREGEEGDEASRVTRGEGEGEGEGEGDEDGLKGGRLVVDDGCWMDGKGEGEELIVLRVGWLSLI